MRDDDEHLSLVQTEDPGKIILFPAHEKLPYRTVFCNPDSDIGPGFDDDYYAAAIAAVQRMVNGKNLGTVETVATLFLFRQYLELALKEIIFHLRWLESENRNVSMDAEIDWPDGH